MSFSIDKQTLEELNLLGKFRHTSVYSIFNKTKTSGGERLLHRLFSKPMDDVAAINARSSVFQWFQQQRLSFPFDVRQVEHMREYLEGGVTGNPMLNLIQMGIRKLLTELTRDERYKKIVQGLQASIVTLQKCHTFVASMAARPGVYAARVQAIQKINADVRLEGLLKTDIYKGLSIKKVAQYDQLLKRTLSREVKEILGFIYEVDMNIAVSEVAGVKGFGYARALPREADVLSVERLWHPSIEKAVGNSLRLHKDQHVLFLTGANMAGKSTWMKSVGVGLYLAHCGFPVAAKSMEFSLRDGLYSSINVADDISQGYSHFYAEVMRVKQAAVATASGQRLVLLFDELFKGTNVKDAFDGTLAVSQAFADYRRCIFIVSTHIIEVGEVLKGDAHIQFAYMPTVMEGVHPRYTYRLQEGITEDRQGMMIIRNEGILEMLR